MFDPFKADLSNPAFMLYAMECEGDINLNEPADDPSEEEQDEDEEA